MDIKPEELAANGYQLNAQMEHNNIVPFIGLYLKKKTTVTICYNLFLISLAVILGFWIYVAMTKYGYEISTCLNYLSYGIALSFVLIPLHEFLHVKAYQWQGAKHTAYVVKLKKLYFLAVADKFVANKKEFTKVALAPLVIISLLGVLVLFFTSIIWSVGILGLLLTHALLSAGDISLVSYFQYYASAEVVTYDDTTLQISYFYHKPLSV